MSKNSPKIRCVLSAHAINGESPAWCPQEQVLYWIDVREPSLHRFDPATGRDRAWRLPSWVGCAVPGGNGKVLMALRDGVGWLDCATGELHMLGPVPFDSRRFFSNDGKCDPQGRFWFGPMYEPLHPAPAVEPDASPLLRFDADTRRCVPQTRAIHVSNGIAWSADGGTMFHADTRKKRSTPTRSTARPARWASGGRSRSWTPPATAGRTGEPWTVKAVTGARSTERASCCVSTRTARWSARSSCR